jgi:hypothetical protein
VTTPTTAGKCDRNGVSLYMDWLLANKEWFFSGIGVFGLTILFSLFNKRKKERTIKQKQYSGADSVNIQVGGDFKK